MIKNCEICNKEFYTKPSKIKIGKGRFCSKKCFYSTQKGGKKPNVSKALKGRIFKGTFKVGHPNYLTEKSIEIIRKKSKERYENGLMKIGIKGQRSSMKTEFKKGKGKNEKNINWRGDAVGYFALHSWVKRRLGKPECCEHCGNIGSYYIRIQNNELVKVWNIQWANKSQKYLRDLSDWLGLCLKCHKKYDSQLLLKQKQYAF